MGKTKELHKNNRWALINDKNIVVNVIKWDGNNKWRCPEGVKMIQSPYAEIGDLYDQTYKNFIKAVSL